MSTFETTITKISEQTENIETDEEDSKKYISIFHKHELLNANIGNGNSLKVKRSSVAKIISMMPEKIKYGISYVLFSITSTETIEEVETTGIMKKLVKKYEYSEVKECHFQTELKPSTKLLKGNFNVNLFKNLEKILNIKKEKEKSETGVKSEVTSTKTQKGKKTIVTETVVVEETVEVQEIQETQKKTVMKSKAPNPKKKKEIEETPQSGAPHSNAPTEKEKRDNDEDGKEDMKDSNKETQKPTRSKKEESKQQPMQEAKKEPERKQQVIYQTQPNQTYTFYSSNSNGLQLPHKYRTHPRVYGKDSRACRVCNNTHGLIRKYKLDICRRCFRERATLLGWKQDK